MRIAVSMVLLLLASFACSNDRKSKSDHPELGEKAEIQFDRSKWSSKDGDDYPFRDQMLNDLLYNDTVRMLDEKEILNLLGEPDRSTDGHLYYMISQKRLGSWPLHTKSLVIKFSNDSAIEWMKIHE